LEIPNYVTTKLSNYETKGIVPMTPTNCLLANQAVLFRAACPTKKPD